MRVDFIVYINLDNRLDRRSHMEGQLAYCPYECERLPATRLDVSPEDAGINMRPRLKGQRGVASIWLSHERAIRRFLETGKDGSFVLLEDDVKIQAEIWPLLGSLLGQLPDDWELALLSPRYRYRAGIQVPVEEQGKRLAKSPVGPVFLPKLDKTYIITGAHFCIFKSPKVARVVLDRMSSTAEVGDVDHFYAIGFNTYGLKSEFVSAGGFGSDHHA